MKKPSLVTDKRKNMKKYSVTVMKSSKFQEIFLEKDLLNMK